MNEKIVLTKHLAVKGKEKTVTGKIVVQLNYESKAKQWSTEFRDDKYIYSRIIQIHLIEGFIEDELFIQRGCIDHIVDFIRLFESLMENEMEIRANCKFLAIEKIMDLGFKKE